MDKFRECDRGSPLSEDKVRAAVQSFNDHVFPAFSRKIDKGVGSPIELEAFFKKIQA